MHEFSLAQGLHDQMIDLAREHEVEKITKAEVSIGDDAGIVAESFVFGFNVLAGQHPVTESCELVIVNAEGKDLMLMRLEMS